MKNRHLIVTLTFLFFIDYVGNRCFELYRYKIWFPFAYFVLICFNFGIGYNFWNKLEERWIKYIWFYIYALIILYYSINWILFLLGFAHNGFLYKTYVHIALTPLTFGFVWLISYLSKVRTNIRE